MFADAFTRLSADVHEQKFIHTDLKPENILLEDASYDTVVRVRVHNHVHAAITADTMMLPLEDKRKVTKDVAKHKHTLDRLWQRNR